MTEQTTIKQDHRLYDLDFDNIKTIEQLCEVLKEQYIQATYDYADDKQKEIVDRLLSKRLIKQVTATLINTNN